ncbi:uncharacterized protein LOC134243624 [Saccostrea cucullata]|uniref:uncharacterized protein LOC134243624 n=1 Tax=Saccostrea cuccullata TaxID=36930 RepID=UPI002ED5669C
MGSSSISQSSSLLARKRALAEAARIKLKFAETEALINKQQAIIEETRKLNIAKAERQNSELEADLKLLSRQSEAAAAAAEVEALEYVDVRNSVLDIPVCDKKKLVKQYVEKHSSHSSVHVKEERHSNVQDCNEISSLCSDTPRDSRKFVPISTLAPAVPEPCADLDSVSRNSVPAGTPLNPQAKAFFAKAHTSTPATSDLKDNIMANELTRFLMKKDLLLSRFTSSFTHIAQDLGVNPREELDLLLKWLGPESSKHAHSIRIAYASDPAKAVQKVWERLDDRYGGPELIECALKQKLTNFPKVTNKDTDKLYALSDLLSEIASIKENPTYASLLAYFDSSSGVNQVVAKLPYNLQMKWMDRASKYKTSQKVSFPPFTFFVNYVKEMTKMMNDPSFQETLQPTPKREETFRTTPLRQPIRVKKTDREQNVMTGSEDHPSALHVTSKSSREKQQEENESSLLASPQHGGEENNSRGTQRSCAKVLLVRVYSSSHPDKSVLTYALLDDQSNRSLATTHLLDLLDVNSEEVEYSLASCAGSFVFSGRVAEDCVVESLDGSVKLNLPPLIECNNIPDVREEIPTPEIARHYTHLMDIQEFIPPLSEARTLLLIGRDLPGAHHVLDQRVGSGNEPFAQRLRLGWIIVGETCLGKVHRNRISVNKTFVLDNGRPTVFRPCENRIHVSEKWDNIGSSVFSRNKDDNKVGLSIEDKQFIRVMEKSLHKDTEGNWVAPLPFRENHPPLPNNRLQTLNRAKNLHASLSKDPVKLQHMVTFMQRVFESKHAEVAPPLTSNEECWYLPIFGVYHPQKPG